MTENEKPTNIVTGFRSIPGEVKIVSVIEALAGVFYLPYVFLSLFSADVFFILYLILAAISFAIAYGLSKLWRWAWYLSFILSIFGIITGSISLIGIGLSETALLQGMPRLVIDILVVGILLTNDVRSAFKLKK